MINDISIYLYKHQRPIRESETVSSLVNIVKPYSKQPCESHQTITFSPLHFSPAPGPQKATSPPPAEPYPSSHHVPSPPPPPPPLPHPFPPFAFSFPSSTPFSSLPTPLSSTRTPTNPATISVSNNPNALAPYLALILTTPILRQRRDLRRRPPAFHRRHARPVPTPPLPVEEAERRDPALDPLPSRP